MHSGGLGPSHLDHDDYSTAVDTDLEIANSLAAGHVHAPGFILSTEELASSFFCLPSVEQLEGPGFPLDKLRDEAASPLFQERGSIIGWNVRKGRRTAISLPDQVRTRICSIEGATGSGKSIALANLFLEDSRKKVIQGGVIVDFHGQLCGDILDQLDEEWLEKTIYITPDLDGCIPLYNPAAPSGHVESRSEYLTDAVRMLYRSNEWGSNHELCINAVLYLLIHGDSLCLGDIPLLLSSDRVGKQMRERILAHITNEEVLRFWHEEYAAVPVRKMVKKAFSKLTPFLSSHYGRMFCQSGNVLDYRYLMDNGFLVLLDLPIGVLGSRQATMMSGLHLADIYAAAMGRAAESVSEPVWGFYGDEMTRISGKVIEEMVINERKTGVAITMAYQSRSLFSERTRAALRNVGTTLALTLREEDAAKMARESYGHVTAEELRALKVGEAYLICSGQAARIRLKPPPRKRADSIRSAIIERNKREYYISADQWEEQLQGRRHLQRTANKRQPKAAREMI
jgi:hypothetical protein